MAGSSVDITARKEAEAVLARNKEELERLISERTAKLQELVGELEHFSYSITHDMRAPLRAMMAFTQVLEELWADSPDQEQKGYLRRIGVAARRMDLLIADALSYSKAVRSELPLAPVDVGQLLRGMLDTYPELQSARHGIVLDRDFPLVMGNEAGLTQCFSNLLENAVKFVKPGEAPQIRVRAEVLPAPPANSGPAAAVPNAPPQWVRLWVEDQGIGISKTMLPRIFHMFARGASEKAGTGIGLALVRKVVDRMGGRVGVESAEGQGSRFWVDLRPGDVRQPAVSLAPAEETYRAVTQ
jgi:signal transduction histidine kinase